MIIVATSDTHKPFDASLVPDGDVVILAGDLMYEGTPDEWPGILASIAALPHKRKIVVPGNHDYHIQNYLGVVKAQLRKAGATLLTEESPMVTIDGVVFGGIPFVTGLYGWAFNRREDEIETYIEANQELFGADVLITHAPPYRILDQVPRAGSVGCMAYNKFYWSRGLEPKHWVFGHIHEGYGTHRTHPEANTLFHNVAMCDRNYDQVNKPHVFEV